MSLRPLLLTSRRTAAVATVAALSLVVPMLGTTTPAAAADPADPVSDVRVGLIQLSRAIAAVGQQPALSDDLPLTDTSVRDLLSLDTAVGTAVDDALSSNGKTTLATLDDAFGSSGPLTVTEVAEDQRTPGAPAGSKEWDLRVRLAGERRVALSYGDDRIQFGTARLGGELAASLDATIRFRYDPKAVALRTFAVVGEPVLTTHVWSREDDSSATTGQKVAIPGFPVIDGFVQLDAAGDATVDATTSLTMRDPNGRGQITTEDFQFSTAADLFTTTTRPADDAVAMDIGLSTSMSDDATGSITVGDRTSAAATYAAPKVQRSAVLSDLASLTRTQALTGFTQYTSALQAVEGSIDQDFPLLDRSLTDLYSPTGDLLGLLTEQATAAIVCGAANTSPPSGAPQPGEVRYCQATTAGFDVDKSAPEVVWSSPDAGVTVTPVSGTGGTLEGTVGTTPTRNVVVTGGDGFPTLRVAFTSSDGTRHVARSALPSIQALGTAVKRLGLGGDVTYDAATKALTVAVSQSLATQTQGTKVPTGGNGNLAPLTGLSGLCQAATGSNPRRCLPTGDRPTDGGGTTVVKPEEGAAIVKLGERRFTADFGIGLDTAAAPEAGQPASAGPTFYLVPGAQGLVYQVKNASAALDGQAAMVARIGFLQTDVDVTSYATGSNGDAASVTVPTTNVTLPSKGEVDDAVAVPSTLQGSSFTPVAKRGLTATADLSVTDSPQDAGGTRPINRSGTVKATWSDLRPGSLPKVTTGGDYDALRLLDIVPARQGVMGAGSGSSAGVVTDPGADFVAQFGLEDVAAADRLVNRPLYDLGGQESSTICTQYLVTSATSLRCTEGPLAEAGATAPGHPYVIDGDQDALRDVVLEDLAGLLNTFNTPSDGQASNKAFPLVDVLPTEISDARDGLGAAVKAVQKLAATDAPSVSVSSTPAGSPDKRAATMQDFARAFDAALPAASGGKPRPGSVGFTLDTGANRLVFASSLALSRSDTAPLKVGAGDSDVKVYSGTEVAPLPVNLASKATFAFGVDLASATSMVRGDTETVERITGIDGLDATRQLLAGAEVDYGSARLTTGAKADVQVGIDVKAVTGLSGSDSTWTPIADFATDLEQTRSVGTAAQGCGGAPRSAEIAACLKLPFAADSGVAALDIALRADEGAASTGGSMKAKPIAYRFLAEGLGALNGSLRDALNGDQTATDQDDPESLPLVGTDLDAGGDVPADVATYVSVARANLKAVEDSVGDTDTVTKLTDELTKALTALNSALVAKKLKGTNEAPVITCSTDPCAKVSDVQSISVPITLTGSQPAEAKVPFQLGPIGSTVVSNLTVPAKATFTLRATIGVARGKGAFVKFTHSTDADPLLKVDVTATLGDYSADTCTAWTRGTEWKTQMQTPIANVDVPTVDAKPRCMDAFVGKFPSVLVDRPGDGGTRLDAHTAVNLPAASGGTDTAYLPELATKKRTFQRKVTGDGTVSAYFESFAGEIGFVDVVGGIDLTWTGAGYGDVKYGELMLDVGTLNEAVFPGFKKALAWTAPLNPAVEQLSKPIPVVSDLSELVGQGPTSMLTLLQKKKTPIDLIVNLLQLQSVVAKKPPHAIDLRPIGGGGLGGFKVEPQKKGVGGKCTESGTLKGDKYEKTVKGGDGSSGRCEMGTLDKAKQFLKGEKPPEDPEGLKVDKAVTSSPYISLPSVSLPVLQDTSQIFNLLQDKGDATLLYVDLGHAGVEAGVSKKFGPFAVGPIPVTATLGGDVTFDGRFAFGFDTRGLSRRIERLSTGNIAEFRKLVADKEKPALFSDGFFVDDLEKGSDVPEIELTFTVTAGAAISIGIVSAGIQGSVTLDLTLDAFDPNGDGKIYSDEFAGTSTGPSCAFNVSSGIAFGLSFFFEIELLFYTLHESFDIVRSPRLKLFEFTCKTETPELATEVADYSVEGRDGVKKRKALVLNMGGRSGVRGAFNGPSDKAEKFTVRQLGQPKDGKVVLQVSAFNLIENHEVDADTVLVADGGDGSDSIVTYPVPAVTTVDGAPQILGPGDDGYVPPTFSVRSIVSGGSEDDTIETSNGDDDVFGGGGNDAIRTGLGDDVVHAGDGNDSVDGGQGTDRLFGDDGKDRIAGGPGADEVRGGEGDDVLDGGVGADPAGQFEFAKADLIRPTLDSGDLVVGGGGADRVTGGDGSDVVVGGAYSDDSPLLKAVRSTTVTGTNATGTMVDVLVDGITTVELPDPATIETDCADEKDPATTGGDIVTGGGERDVVIGGNGSDTLSGGGGDDRVCGRGGNDLLDGDGDDVVGEEQGDDTVSGGSGDDRVYGSGGDDVLGGDAGDDLVRGGAGDDTIAGGAGSDLLLGEKGVDAVDGDALQGTAAVAADGVDEDASGRRVTCTTSTSIVGGLVDLDGDLAGNDTGWLEGLRVEDGKVQAPAGGLFTGSVANVVFTKGEVDLDGDGRITARTRGVLGDTGSIPLAGLTGAKGNGDCILGGEEADTRLSGGAGADYIDAGAGDDQDVHGGVDDDLVRGGEGADLVHGDEGDDLVAGDVGDDILFGDAGADVLRGGADDDLLAGGNPTADAPDGADEVLGDGGDDVALGGNAALTRSAPSDTAIDGVGVTLLATPQVDPKPGEVVTDDLVFGGVGDDWVFGQTGDDETHGGPGEDVVEGGPGADLVQGDDGRDLLVGGSSTTGAVTTDRTAAGEKDGADRVVGDGGVDGLDGSDVMVGDNARLEVTASPRFRWEVRDDVDVELFDVPQPGQAPSAVTSGGDILTAGGAADLVFGQSGDDTVAAGDGDDAVEGGAGLDTLAGDAGDDVIIGGSSSRDGVMTADRDGSGQLDARDVISGGTGDDVLAGDNARVELTPDTRDDGTPLRPVQLFDLATASKPAPAGTSGADVIDGEEGRDLVFGQGGSDALLGGSSDDYLEGGDGDDGLVGGPGEDDLVGGGSSRTGAIVSTSGGKVTDRLLTAPEATTDVSASGLLDGNDRMDGGEARDVLLGDNGRITREGPNTTLSGGASGTHVVREVAMADKVPGVWSGSDNLIGGAGDDDLYGQFDNTGTRRTGQRYGTSPVPGDVLAGGLGDDALVGDQGVDVPTPVAELGSIDKTLKDRASFISELVRPRGRLVRVVTLTHAEQGGDDLLLADDGDDAVHAGAGKDVVNAGGGDDAVFGGDGNDALWGGTGHDRVFGGQGNDLLDVKRRASHPPLWVAAAPAADTDNRRATTNGGDVLFGGAGADALQSDEGDLATAGRRLQGDRLIDWPVKINAYAVCTTGRGTGKVMSASSSSMIDTLREVARSSGAVGSGELAVPFFERITQYPGKPGLVCER